MRAMPLLMICFCSLLLTGDAFSQTEEIKDWPMWGGTAGRNMVSGMKGVSTDFDLEKGTKVNWSVGLGSQTYGNPIIADGKVFVGTNNGAGYRDKYPADKDLGVLLCFDEKSGDFIWQLTRDKLPAGRVNDWPLQGICSAPVIEGDRMYVVTNRCELMCLDVNGFTDGKMTATFKMKSTQKKKMRTLSGRSI